MSFAAQIAFAVARCLAAGLTFYATAKHPYNYYVFTRWTVFFVCLFGVVQSSGRARWFVPAYVAVGLLFNPFLPFHFERATWRILDVIAGLTLLTSLAFNPPAQRSQD